MIWWKLWRLSGRLQSRDASVVRAAVHEIAMISDPRVVRPLFSALKGADPDTSDLIVKSVRALGEAAAVPLMEVLRTDAAREEWTHDCAVTYAAEILGELEEPRSVPALVQTLRDKSVNAQKAAAEALGRIGDLTAVPALEQTRHANPASVWVIAEESIRRIRGAVPTVVRRAVKVRGNSDLGLTNNAVAVINSLAERKDVGVLSELIRLLREGGNAQVRSVIAARLPAFGDARVSDVLVDALEDAESDVREAAAEALKVLDWQPTEPGQRALQCILAETWDQVAQYGVAAVPPLLGVLTRRNVKSWHESLSILGRLGDVRAVMPIFALLADLHAFSGRVPSVLQSAMRPLEVVDETSAAATLKPIKDLVADIEGDRGRMRGLVSVMMVGLMNFKMSKGNAAVLADMLMPVVQVVVQCDATLKQINQSVQSRCSDPDLQRTVEQAGALAIASLANMQVASPTLVS